MVKLCLGFLVDCVKWLAKRRIFIHADILVLVIEFVVVVILSEWWLFYLSGGWSQLLLTAVGIAIPAHARSENRVIDNSCTD